MENPYEKFYSEPEDVLDWTKEANGVIQDIIRHVKEAKISNVLIPTESEVFINLRTLEETEVCVKLNGQGLQIVGDRFDCVNLADSNDHYETPYALLSSVSPAYVESFGTCLADALGKRIQDQLVGSEAGIDNEDDVKCPDSSKDAGL
ncbi:GSK3-beta interaction protein [Armigeres subalbatus]|uniref:GSK3-beta interaction protein n=1 Tax=Armigeres subalbatus TaxID=124917 RepID=UPI002ED21649